MASTPRTRNRFAGQGDRINDSGVDKWINIFGDVQVIENLGRLNTAVERKLLKKAIGKGLKVIVRIAKQNVPVKSGLLRRSIRSKVTRMISGKVYVDPKVVGKDGDKPAKYAHVVEFGGPKHPRPYPFMRPALDAGRNEALEQIAQSFREELQNFNFK
jgi:HK97 gp10 family phage protein